jgi:uncharacterized membrane protein
VRYAGELAALGTALCWATGSNLFAGAGKRMGSAVLNRLRITIAFFLLVLTLLATRGAAWPVWATGRQVLLLALSGLIGFVFGDRYYFKSLVILGPGRASLLASSAPLFTALLALPVLGEKPGPLALLGMALTLSGIFLALSGRPRQEQAHAEGSVAVGVLSGALGALGQAVGFVISKLALRTGLDPLSATVIRITAAAAAIWVITLFGGAAGVTLAALRDRRASLFMIGGATFGPFLGVLLSLLAIQTIDTGVAASIIAIYPVLAMLIASRFHGEPLTLRTLGGTLVAVAGVVILFLR